MRSLRRLAGLSLAATPPGILFLAQTWLVASGQTEAVLSLAKYGGLLGLVFFAFDGSSGLLPAMMRVRHGEAAVRRAYLVYRMGVLTLLLGAVPVFWHLAPEETASLFPFLAMALLLRFPFLDADLDRRGLQHWSMLLQNGWMGPLCLGVVFSGGADATMAGHAALWGAVALAATHLVIGRTRQSSAKSDFRPALLEILGFLGAQGVGQVYGRVVLFVLGTAFAGPVASLLVYAKQAFNAAGLVVVYLRRIELAEGRASMRLSLWGQAGIAVVASVLVALAALRLGQSPGLVLALIGWQSLEKLSTNAAYAMQLRNRYDLALVALLGVAVLGLCCLWMAIAQASALVFVTVETLGYGVVLIVWWWSRRNRLVGAQP